MSTTGLDGKQAGQNIYFKQVQPLVNSEQVTRQLRNGIKPPDVEVSLKLSDIK